MWCVFLLHFGTARAFSKITLKCCFTMNFIQATMIGLHVLVKSSLASNIWTGNLDSQNLVAPGCGPERPAPLHTEGAAGFTSAMDTGQAWDPSHSEPGKEWQRSGLIYVRWWDFTPWQRTCVPIWQSQTLPASGSVSCTGLVVELFHSLWGICTSSPSTSHFSRATCRKIGP